MRARFGARRAFEGLDVSSRHPCFGFCCLRLDQNEQFAAQRLWQESQGNVDTMIAALSDAERWHDQYRAVIEEAEATDFWTAGSILEHNPNDVAARVRFVDRLREIVGEARSDA